MKPFYLFCLAGLLLLGTGCKKSTDTPATYYAVNPEVLSYLKMPLGSYFIYKDSTSGILDSITVKKSDVQKLFFPAHKALQSSWPFAGTYTATIPDSYYDSLTLQLTKESTNGAEDWLFISHLQDQYSNYYKATDSTLKIPKGMVFWYPSITTSFTNTENYGGYIIPSMIIEGNTYQNVLRFISSNSDDPSALYYLKTDYYWAKGVGVIKRIITTSKGVQTSTLVRKG